MKKIYFLGLAFSLFFGFVSCDKDDGPDYVGTWTVNQQMEIGEVRNNLTLTTSTFEVIINKKVNESVYVELAGIKGECAISDSIATLTPSAIGMADVNSNGAFIWYDKGTEEYNTYNELYFNFPSTVDAYYEVNGDELILKMDVDGDGEYSTDEIIVYTRV